MTLINGTISNTTIYQNAGLLTGVPAITPSEYQACDPLIVNESIVNESQTYNPSQPQSSITSVPKTATHEPTISHTVSQSLSHTITSSHALITSTDINLALIGVGISILIGVILVYRRR